MSDTGNPYQSPAAETQALEPLTAQTILTETMLKHLNDASPWLRFMGVMGFVTSGMIALGGISSLAFLPLMGSVWSILPDPFGSILGSIAPAMALYSFYFLGAAVLSFFPALFTYRFGAKIKNFMQSNSISEMELALQNNKSLWKFNGILMIVSLAIVPITIVIMVVVIIAAFALG